MDSEESERMKAKLIPGALVGACLVVSCSAPPSTPPLSSEQAAALRSTATSARYRLMAAATDSNVIAVAGVTASSVRNDYFRTDNAVDGKLTSAWGPAASDPAPSLTFDLGGCFDLTGFAIKASGGSTVDVATWVNGAWQTVATNLTPEQATLDWVALGITAATQVKLTFHGDASQLLVCEVQWHGTPCSPATPSPSPSPTAPPSTAPSPVPSIAPSPTPTPEEDCGCKVTGGGFTFLEDHTRVSFGFNAQHDRAGHAKGEVNMVVHSRPTVHWHSETITDVICDVDPGLVFPRLTGTVTVRGTLKTGQPFTLVLVDTGEPGVLDDISMSIEGTVVFHQDLGGDGHGGGNIQLHREACD
jgi:hypothetical protein